MPTCRVMIVEDESLVAEDLSVFLRRSGYDVVGVADTCAAAEALADATRPDLALLDIRLKGPGDGILLASELRRRDIGYVYLTSHSDDGTLARAEVTEPLGYVLKPFSTTELVPVLRTAMYRHAAELRMRNVAQWLRTTLHSIGDAVFVTDEQARLDFANPAAERLLRRSWSEIAGSVFAETVRIVAPASDVAEPCVVQRALRTGQTVFLADGSELLLEDGTRLPIDDCASPIRDRHGRVGGVVVVMRDATERRHAERQRIETERRLLDAERLQGVAAIASGLAHDLNNMLAGILGNATMCRDQVASAAGVAAVERIEDGARAAAQLCRRMLDGASAAPMAADAVDLGTVVADGVARERALAPESLRFEVEAPPHAVFVHADSVQLMQVVQNLLRNAAEAMDGRSGTIRARWQAVTLPPDGGMDERSTRLPPGRYARFDVADEGAGMAADVLARIFEPFFTTKVTGRGLGLVSVLGIVRRHGGSITARSQPGRGAEFVVHWPLAPEPAGAVPAIGTVLVVDDDGDVRTVTSRILQLRGWQCLEAASGAEALELLAGGRHVDVVLLDVMMPGMDGVAVLRGIRARFPTLPVVLVSGAATHTDLGSLDACTEFLAKPYAVETMLAKLARWVAPK